MSEKALKNLNTLSLILSVLSVIVTPFMTYAVASAVHGEQINSLRAEMSEVKNSRDKILTTLDEIRDKVSDIRDRLSKVEGHLSRP
jgi:hypothetical protein